MSLTDAIDNILGKAQNNVEGQNVTTPDVTGINPEVVTIVDNSNTENPENVKSLDENPELSEDEKSTIASEATEFESSEALDKAIENGEVETTSEVETNQNNNTEGDGNMSVKDAILGNQNENTQTVKSSYPKEEMDAFFSFDRFFNVKNEVTEITYSMNGAEVEQIIGALPQYKHLKVKLMNGESICKDATYTVTAAK